MHRCVAFLTDEGVEEHEINRLDEIEKTKSSIVSFGTSFQ